MPSRESSSADNLAQLVSELRTAVFESPGRVDASLRRSAATGEGLSEPWSSYTREVRDEPWSITGPEVASLKATGHSEDEIFEMTIAAAVGASLRALEAGLRVVG